MHAYLDPHMDTYIQLVILMYTRLKSWFDFHSESHSPCRQPGDDEKMLFCDECDKGFHTYCLSPPMSSVPKTAWKCYVSLLFL